MKRFLGILTAVCLLLAPVASLAAFDYSAIPTPHMLVVDANDLNHVFYERAADERAFPASTTKIMTCILAIESGSLDDTVTVGDEVTTFTNYSSLMGLKSGETVTMRDLVYGLMLVSGNDAAAAIAVHVAGSIDGFVSKMNEKAAAIGMSATHFTNPHGVQNDEHYTTARDMARLTAYALQNAEFLEIDQTKTYTVPASNLRSEPLTMVTTNRLLRKVEGDAYETVYPYAIGGKTGDTDAAGKCLVAVAERDGARVIVVLFGDMADMYGGDKDKNNLARFSNAASIFEHVFNDEYVALNAAELGLNTAFEADAPGGNGTKLQATADLSGAVYRADANLANNIRANAGRIGAEVRLTEGLFAPVSAGQDVGRAVYSYEGRTLFTAPLTAQNDVAAGTVAAPDGSGAAGGEDTPFAPTETPLLEHGRKDWSTSDVLTLVLVLLVVLLVALVVVFFITERKRRYERKRRQARLKRRKY